MIVKAWLKDDCRRFSIERSQVTYQTIRRKIFNLYQLPQYEDSFCLQYRDADGDVITVASNEDVEEILRNDAKDDSSVLKVRVHLSTSTGSSDTGLEEVTGAMGGMAVSAPELDSGLAASAGVDILPRAERFEGNFTDREVLEILRDISLYISCRGTDKAPVRQWVSSEKNLITPGSTPSPHLRNAERYTRVHQASTTSHVHDESKDSSQTSLPVPVSAAGNAMHRREAATSVDDIGNANTSQQ
ncbi:uncharacterized protein SPPG_04574 [Spizellomyces punctatus DAOM BR117]|uniref:PB1 domain-containing protein n=1 Tax=Spizellomyces punctatus (strain DAOM BR117) TaxID=645134 RepID=A0A0L0HGQ5_SPIPD|nr:uncharacterized protein SPPG_04574 [Spizellomyces punctatus DAOM BR117]KND00242.1 hypothetical protein SPPG_04574 [Spizellomyces punctatus DAOM BR117]|eukprot:XP_016608281.1 hypothetical protein SPPG_04574 [Spizellomyces punctatus DAOM BR117]